MRLLWVWSIIPFFTRKISTRVVCVNGEHPRSTPYFSYEAFAGLKHYTLFYAQDFHPSGLCKWWAPPVLPRTSVMRLLLVWSIIPFFTRKISTRVVCVNGEHPPFYPVLQLWGFYGFEALYSFLRTRSPPGWFVSMLSTPCSTPYFSYEAFAGLKYCTPFYAQDFHLGGLCQW